MGNFIFRGNHFDIRTVDNLPDMIAMAQNLRADLGETAVSDQAAAQRFAAFPSGTLGCYFCEQLVATVGIYALDAPTYQHLLSGQTPMVETPWLDAAGLAACDDPHLFVTHLWLADVFRGVGASPLSFVADAALQLLTDSTLLDGKTAHLFAFPYAPESIRMLRRFGFAAVPSIDYQGNPVYGWSGNKTQIAVELQGRLQNLLRLSHRHIIAKGLHGDGDASLSVVSQLAPEFVRPGGTNPPTNGWFWGLSGWV
jgi:hypothetical protein